ncbi:MAG: DUF4861 family protein [Bacteroidales bacterium]|nr:DUF4861 family protein [Bacteroidales bacterium]
MKKFLILQFVLIISILACSNGNNYNGQSSSDSTSVSETPKTYAEISIKEGGEWKDRKYEGGTFKNIRNLKVPAAHTDHSFYIRYEGPGWESNKVGYRLYLDWRNAIDIFGKVTDSMVLSQVGLDGFDSYHEKCSWGQDILKVGKGLGVGSIGRYVDNEVLHFKEVDSTFASVENSISESKVLINYYDWKTASEKINLNSELSISPDKRYTKHTIQSSKAISGICTGIVNHKVEVFKKESENKKWAYLATYGAQTLVSETDKLGMAIFYKVGDVESQTVWEFDHLVIFNPTIEPISFYFLGAWEGEKDGIKTKEAFISYLDKLLSELNSQDKLQ